MCGRGPRETGDVDDGARRCGHITRRRRSEYRQRSNAEVRCAVRQEEPALAGACGCRRASRWYTAVAARPVSTGQWVVVPDVANIASGRLCIVPAALRDLCGRQTNQVTLC